VVRSHRMEWRSVKFKASNNNRARFAVLSDLFTERWRRGGDTAAMCLLSGADMTATGFAQCLIVGPLRQRFSQERYSVVL
jgi:hypothetical protein